MPREQQDENERLHVRPTLTCFSRAAHSFPMFERGEDIYRVEKWKSVKCLYETEGIGNFSQFSKSNILAFA